jgi:hypothetical protein
LEPLRCSLSEAVKAAGVKWSTLTKHIEVIRSSQSPPLIRRRFASKRDSDLSLCSFRNSHESKDRVAHEVKGQSTDDNLESVDRYNDEEIGVQTTSQVGYELKRHSVDKIYKVKF